MIILCNCYTQNQLIRHVFTYLCTKSTMMAEQHDLGREGEERAREYLRSLGCEILDCNWRFGSEEIDIIAKDGGTLIVAEVKTRKSSYYGEPELAVDKKKQKILVRAADAYINQKKLDLEVRFDIIAIIIGGGNCSINHIPDAFYPTL
jgi:putative endonuclease